MATFSEEAGVICVEHQFAAGGDDQAGEPAEFLRHRPLEEAEGRLASLSEDLRDGHGAAFLDEAVGIDEAVAEAAGEDPADGRLAAAHETGEDDVLAVH